MIDGEGDDRAFPDRYNTVYVNVFFQGISTVLPWNTLLFAHSYFASKLASVPAAKNFILYFVLIFMFMKIVFLISGVSLIGTIRPNQQVLWSTGASILVFITVGAVSTFSPFTPLHYFYVLLGLVVLAALFSAFVEAGFLAVLSHFPPNYTQSYLIGHGFAGVVSAALQICTAMGTASVDSRRFAELYFGMATVVMVLSLFLFYHTMGIDMFKHYYEQGLKADAAKVEADRLAHETGLASHASSITSIFLKIDDLFFTIILIGWINITVFPLLIFMTQPANLSKQAIAGSSALSPSTFFHVIALLISSIFDLLGKAMPAITALAIKKLPFLWLSLARIIVLPLMLMGNIQIAGYKLPFEPVYANDAVFYSLLALKTLSGAYLGTLCMMWSPMRVKPMDRSLALKIMVYGMALGLLAGAASAFLLEYILEIISTKV